jgi:hypothetical protein
MATVQITITHGTPSTDPANINAGDFVEFVNGDIGTDYLIEFQRKDNGKHDPLCIPLDAEDSFTVRADPKDPHDKNCTCYYNILDSSGNVVGPIKAGHSIIVGNGLDS